jgi:hypothetical protein
MAERLELGSKAEHLLDLALRAAANGRTADTARLAASAARYFHYADALRASAPCVQQAEHFLDRALNAAAHGHIAATARLAANAAQHFQKLSSEPSPAGRSATRPALGVSGIPASRPCF